MRNVADTGLQILYQLLLNIEQHEQAGQSFYQTYFTDILQHVFSVVTDTSHTAGKVIYLYTCTIVINLIGLIYIIFIFDFILIYRPDYARDYSRLYVYTD